MTELHLAAKHGNERRIKRLLDEGAKMDVSFGYLGTPLCSAAAAGHEACIDLLIRRGASVSAKNAGGMTALH